MKSSKSVTVIVRESVRWIVLYLQHQFLVRFYGMRIAPSARISFGAKLDKTNPTGIVIGEQTYVASGAIILSHDYCRGIKSKTIIGERCFIGTNVIILPGVNIGNSVIVGAGSVVTKDIPRVCIVAGNPAKILRTGISTEKWGKLSIST